MLYLGVSSGATLHYQYCMGRLIKVTLWHGDSKKCRTCGMERQAKLTKKCCTDKHQQLKSEKSSSISHSQLSLGTSAVILPSVPFFGVVSSPFVPLMVQYPVSQAPPLSLGVAVFLRNCIFRI
nr:hypothetical protein [Mucilaginibacter sp. JXJ CY 39]